MDDARRVEILRQARACLLERDGVKRCAECPDRGTSACVKVQSIREEDDGLARVREEFR
jgi:hypothetical protein